ncbi:MAG: hypothetical protein ACI8PP_001325 [Candidatus Pseudothioglobus sp.]|jgi:hypothetical protein
MQIFEIAIITSALAILSGLVLGMVLLLLQRRALTRQVELQRQDMQANQIAVYGMAKHLRGLQKMVDDQNVVDRQMDNVEQLISSGADVATLADELGVSRTEAEIITHIRPLRSAGVTARRG